MLVHCSRILLCCAVAFGVLISPALAETKIAFVDLEQALSRSKQGSAAREKYQDELADAQKKIDRKKQEYERLRDQFVKQRDSLNESALRAKEEEIISLEKELKRNFTDSQEGLRRMHMQLVGELVQQIRILIQEIGKREGYTLILEQKDQAVIYADTAIDITDKVVEEFNKKN